MNSKINKFVTIYLPLIASFVMVFVMGLQKNHSPDFGFHLQSAKWIIENGKIISQDYFTYTSFGNNYYDLQWLYQLIIFGLFKIGKDGLLIVFNSLLISLCFFLCWFRYKKISSKQNPALFLMVVIISVQALPFEIRPHVFSWIFLSMLLLILESYRGGNAKALFLLPVIMILWVNSHSLSILGLVAIGIYFIGGYYETKKVDKRFLSFTVLSFLAFLVNPYFIDGFLLPFQQFSIIKGDALQKNYIGELQTPFTLIEAKRLGLAYLISPLYYLQLYSLAALWIGIKLLLKRKITHSILIFVFFVLLCLAMKNYGYFLIISLPVVTGYLAEWRVVEQKKQKPLSGKSNNKLAITGTCLALIISWLSITDGYSILRQSPYRFGFTVDERSVPVEATAFLNKNKIYGKLLNHLDFGGYMMFNYPEKVFIDGRLELPKPEFFKKYFNGLNPGGLESLLAEYDPEVIIFPYTKAVAWWSYLIKSKNYRAVYFDGLAAIYLKNGTFENIPALTEKDIKVSSNENIYSLIQEEKPSRVEAVSKSFFQKQYIPIEEQNKATFCFTYGYEKAALEYSAIGIKKATVNPIDIFYNLSLYFTDIKKYNEAGICRKKTK